LVCERRLATDVRCFPAPARCLQMLNGKPFSQVLFDERFKGKLVKYSRDAQTGEIKSEYPPSLSISIPVSKDGDAFLVDGFYAPDKTAMTVTPENASEMIARHDLVRSVVVVDKVCAFAVPSPPLRATDNSFPSRSQQLWASGIGFGIKLRLFQARVYRRAFYQKQDLCGGDDEDIDPMEMAHQPSLDEDIMGDSEDEKRAHLSLSGMRPPAASASAF
jgi:hypothetical protein